MRSIFLGGAIIAQLNTQAALSHTHTHKHRRAHTTSHQSGLRNETNISVFSLMVINSIDISIYHDGNNLLPRGRSFWHTDKLPPKYPQANVLMAQKKNQEWLKGFCLQLTQLQCTLWQNNQLKQKPLLFKLTAPCGYSKYTGEEYTPGNSSR